MSSHTCPRCGVVTDPVLPGGLCVTCHGRADDTRQSVSVVADAPTPSFDPDTAGTFTFATPTDTTVTHGEAGADPFGVLPAGGYVYGEVLGTGGMGCVYQAVRVSTGQTVAIKKLRAERYTPSLLRRFVQEARILSRVDHPNVVRLHDFVPDPGDPHIVMDFVDGCSLADRLADGKVLPPGEAARLMADAARGVAAAHAAGGIHRDLKPGNLLVTKADQIKVSDFGLGKLTDPGDGLTLTGDGQLVGGTPGYMAPEQIDETAPACDARTDVWGLGACLYACLVGRPPFPTGTKNATRVLSDPLVPPRSVKPAVPPVLDAVVCKCLERDPANRYPTAADVAADLDRYLRGESTVAKPLPWATRVWRRARGVHRGLVVAWAVAAIAGVIALLATPRPPRDLTTIQPLATGGEEKADALATLEAEFKAGRTVTLVPEKGLPRWSEWVDGGPDVHPSRLGDEAAEVETITLGALKLFARPGDRYRIELELRHLSGFVRANPLATWVGVFFAHTRAAGAEGSGELLDSMMAVKFADIDLTLPDRGQPTPQPLNFAYWNLYRPHAGSPRWTSHHVLPDGLRFAASPTLPGPWRRLVVDVTPDGVHARWYEAAAPPLPDPLEMGVTAGKLGDVLRDVKAGIEAKRRVGLKSENPAMFPTRWEPNGGIGLLCSGSALAFRNVAITPLNP
jgi:hypothetical protein